MAVWSPVLLLHALAWEHSVAARVLLIDSINRLSCECEAVGAIKKAALESRGLRPPTGAHEDSWNSERVVRRSVPGPLASSRVSPRATMLRTMITMTG